MLHVLGKTYSRPPADFLDEPLDPLCRWSVNVAALEAGLRAEREQREREEARYRARSSGGARIVDPRRRR